jgi:hypothetical protein
MILSYYIIFFYLSAPIRRYFGADVGCPLACPLCDRIKVKTVRTYCPHAFGT